MNSTNPQTTKVETAIQLKLALADIVPGAIIQLNDLIFQGNFIISDKQGTPNNPIIIRGSRNTILTGGDISNGYSLYINKCSNIILDGFTIKGGQKGIMLDSSNYCKLINIEVYGVGMEAIHLRTNSMYNIIDHCYVHNTGLKSPQYGEGIYIGSSKSNIVNDKSDYNTVSNCTIGPNVTAESIDIKEYSSYGTILNNTLDGTGMSGKNYADSLIDVKGNNYIIKGNTCKNTLLDGIQVHVLVKGWGQNNTFDNNTFEDEIPGYAIMLQNAKDNVNIVYDNNKALHAKNGLTNTTITSKNSPQPTPQPTPVSDKDLEKKRKDIERAIEKDRRDAEKDAQKAIDKAKKDAEKVAEKAKRDAEKQKK